MTRSCALEQTMGRVVACPESECPFWEPGGAVLPGRCAFDRLDLGGRTRGRGRAPANSCATRVPRLGGGRAGAPSPLPPPPQRERRRLRRRIETIAQCEERVTLDRTSPLLREVQGCSHVRDLLRGSSEAEVAAQDFRAAAPARRRRPRRRALPARARRPRPRGRRQRRRRRSPRVGSRREAGSGRARRERRRGRGSRAQQSPVGRVRRSHFVGGREMALGRRELRFRVLDGTPALDDLLWQSNHA